MTRLFGEFFEVAESAAECGLGNGDSAARALLPLQLHLLVLHVTHLALGLQPLAVVQLVGLQRLHQQPFTRCSTTRTIGCHSQEQTDLIKTHFIICLTKLSMSAVEYLISNLYRVLTFY